MRHQSAHVTAVPPPATAVKMTATARSPAAVVALLSEDAVQARRLLTPVAARLLPSPTPIPISAAVVMPLVLPAAIWIATAAVTYDDAEAAGSSSGTRLSSSVRKLLYEDMVLTDNNTVTVAVTSATPQAIDSQGRTLTINAPAADTVSIVLDDACILVTPHGLIKSRGLPSGLG